MSNGGGPSALPRFCLVADGFASGRVGLDAVAIRGRVVELVSAGVRWVWLRDHGADAESFDRAARRLAERVMDLRPDVVLSVGTHAATAAALGAHLHVGTRGDGLAQAAARGISAGVSAHSPGEVAHAASSGAAYATLSPLFPTRTHPGAKALGVEVLGEASRAGIPVVALGGITPERARLARSAGAHGVAVLSDVMMAPRPVWRFDQYAEALG